MSKNLDQIFIANPITTNASTDLMYFMQSPYSSGTDAAMTYANFSAQFGAPYTAAALTRVNDTNVTLTLGGTPATALLQAASITAGWTGTLSGARGGTGVANTGLTINLGSPTTGYVLTSDVSGNATWQAVPAPTGQALTRTNDTNVTVTLGGTPATSLLAATSLTLGWTGQLAVSRGGTGNSTFTAYSVICAGTTSTGAFQNVSGVGTAGQVLTSNGAAALPTWQAGGGGGGGTSLGLTTALSRGYY